MAVAPNTVRLVLSASQESSQRISVFHFRTTAAHVWTSSELAALCSAFWTAVGPAFKSATQVGVTFVSVSAIDMGNDPAQSGTFLIPAGNVGTVGGEALPASAAAVLSWRTTYTGRKYRGRTYLYGMGEAQTNGSLLTTSAVALATAIGSALLGFVNGTGTVVALSVYSTVLNASNIIQSFIVDNLVDSQRRRLLGRGN